MNLHLPTNKNLLADTVRIHYTSEVSQVLVERLSQTGIVPEVVRYRWHAFIADVEADLGSAF